MNRVQRLLAWAFGAIFVALSVVVSVETLTRKVFNYSIQGADELGGYALAAGSVIARSDNTLRSIMTPALPRPSIKRL